MTDAVTRQDLVADLEAGATPRHDWRIGIEHESFPFRRSDRQPPSYDGVDGIRALLERLAGPERSHKREGGSLLGLDHTDGSSISLEPGGQLEFASAPLADVGAVADALADHLAEAGAAARSQDLGILGLGFPPQWPLAAMPRTPQSRFEIMRRYMPRVGRRGLDMMHRTASIQLNLDFADEADMVEKLRIALALQPVAVALAANAPFCDGTPSGAVSERGLVWLDVDEERCGVPRFVFEDGMGFERWVDYALSVPMYSVVRDGRHVDLAGRSFRDFMAGELEALPGERPTLADWRSHLNTLMPEVRLKQHLELRGADSGSPATAAALCAFWTGLLYDPAARAEAAALVGGWTEAQRCRLRRSAPVLGLCAPFGRRTLGDLAAEAVAIAARGLAALAAQGADDRRFLEPFVAASADGRAPADHLLTAFRGPWLEDLAPLYEACDLAAP